ncbi:phage tail protein, partial [Escherichia coli]|nr:phage tail protein [Escherichia coli]
DEQVYRTGCNHRTQRHRTAEQRHKQQFRNAGGHTEGSK